MSERTVAAISTPLGEGAIGVIRISGEKAVEAADRIFFPVSGEKLSRLEGYRASYGEIRDNGRVIDDAVALVFRAPKSYTGEDVVEISVHGGRLMLKEVLRLILANGAFPAEPGEFTKRAFLNGKLDLTKAESIMGLISAGSAAELRLSRAAHTGGVSRRIEKIEKSLTAADAAIAVYSDYPDEEIEGLDYESFLSSLNSARAEMADMLSVYDAGRVIREGIDTVIVGSPNVGKSTLMNMLSGTERSIVTDIAGTTRDVVEETVTIGDVVLRLADTAGIRGTDDKVESIGVERARQRLAAAALVLAVFDCTKPLNADDYTLLSELKRENTIVIINKTDLEAKIDLNAFAEFLAVETSAKSGEGYAALCNAIAELSGTAGLDPDSAVLMNERQRACAERALAALDEAVAALTGGCTMDAVGVCVDDALSALFELTGKRVTNEVTDEIFRSFCVGK